MFQVFLNHVKMCGNLWIWYATVVKMCVSSWCQYKSIQGKNSTIRRQLWKFVVTEIVGRMHILACWISQVPITKGENWQICINVCQNQTFVFTIKFIKFTGITIGHHTWILEPVASGLFHVWNLGCLMKVSFRDFNNFTETIFYI